MRYYLCLLFTHPAKTSRSLQFRSYPQSQLEVCQNMYICVCAVIEVRASVQWDTFGIFKPQS